MSNENSEKAQLLLFNNYIRSFSPHKFKGIKGIKAAKGTSIEVINYINDSGKIITANEYNKLIEAFERLNEEYKRLNKSNKREIHTSSNYVSSSFKGRPKEEDTSSSSGYPFISNRVNKKPEYIELRKYDDRNASISIIAYLKVSNSKIISISDLKKKNNIQIKGYINLTENENTMIKNNINSQRPISTIINISRLVVNNHKEFHV